MSQHLFAKDDKDSLILDRIYQYREANLSEFESKEDNVYTKFRYNVERRNLTLWLIPTMYVVAKDPREYIQEAYSKVKFKDAHNFDINAVPYVKEAFEARKWAFAADYIRMYALYTQGGIYLDSDVVLLKKFDDFLDNAFLQEYTRMGVLIKNLIPITGLIRNWQVSSNNATNFSSFSFTSFSNFRSRRK